MVDPEAKAQLNWSFSSPLGVGVTLYGIGGRAQDSTQKPVAPRTTPSLRALLADSVTYQRFVLDMESPWNLPGQTVHVWHNKFSVSGTITMSQADAELTALDLWQPIAALVTSKTSLIGWSYYQAESRTANAGATYAPGTHQGTNVAFISDTVVPQQLEVCMVARAPLPDKNSRGKEVYLRKWIHDASAGTDPNTIAHLNDPTTTLAKWNNGSGPHNVVPVDPTGGKPGTPWSMEQHLYTHQLRRGPRKKKAPAAGGNLGNLLQDLAALKQLAQGIAEAA